MMTPFEIRPATDADGNCVGRIIAAAFSEYEGCHYDRALEFPELDRLAAHFAALSGMCWVACIDSSVVGCAAVKPMERPLGSWVPAMELSKVYLDRQCRGRGIADRLVTTAVDFAAQNGAAGVELWTDTRFTAAHRFYARLGFVFTGWTRAIDDISDTVEFHFRRPCAFPGDSEPGGSV